VRIAALLYVAVELPGLRLGARLRSASAQPCPRRTKPRNRTHA